MSTEINWDAINEALSGNYTGESFVNAVSLEEKAKATSEQLQRIKQIHAEQLELRKADEASWVGRLGLDKDGILGGIVNIGANVAERGGAMLGQVGSTYHSSKAAALDQHIPDEVKLARQRQLAGQATPADEKLLSLPEGYLTEEDANRISYAKRVARERSGFRSNLERIKGMEEEIEKAKAARDFWTKDSWFNESITLKSRSNEMQRDTRREFKGVKEDWDQGAKAFDEGDFTGAAVNVTKAIGKSIAGIGNVAVENPQAAVELLANQVPQFAAGMLFGPAGMGATSLIYAVDEYNKGVVAHQEKYGRLPTEEENDTLAMKAAGLMAAEFLGQYVTLGAGKQAMKALTPAVREAGEETAETLLRRAVRSSVQNAGTRTALAGAEGATGEFFPEAAQTYLENSLVGKDASAEDLYIGGTLGAIAGGGIATGSRALNEGLNALKSAEAKPADAGQAPKIKSDTEALLPENVEQNPLRAMEAVANYSQSDTASPEQKSANLDKADEILQTLELQYEDALESLMQVHPQVRAKTAAELPGLESELAALPESETEQRAELEKTIKRYKDLLAVPEATLEQQKEAMLRMKALEQQVLEARNLRQQMEATAPNATESDEIEDSPEAVQAAVDRVTQTQDPAEAQKAASQVVSLAMRMPESLSEEQIELILAAPNTGLTEAQKTFLRKFSEARVLENKLKTQKGVNQEILYGKTEGIPMKGIRDYRRLIGSALSRGNEKTASRELNLLTKFAEDHRAKSEAVKAAQKKAKETGQQHQVQKNQVTGKWFVSSTLLEGDARAENGALTIGKSSNYERIVQGIETEAQALEAARDELTAAVNLRFKPSSQPATSSPTQVNSSSVGSDVPNTVSTPAPSQAASITDVMDTQDVYEVWSNVRDGSDRQAFRDQITSVQAMYAGKVQAGQEQEARQELSKQFKWFRAASEEQQTAFVTSLVQSSPSSPTQVNFSSVDSQAAPAAQSEQPTEPSNQSNVDSTVDSASSELSASTEAQAAPASSELTESSFPEAMSKDEDRSWEETSVDEAVVTGPRLKAGKPELTQRVGRLYESLMRLADSAGWAQVGGRLLRDASGNVTGRTIWIPKAEWFGAGMESRPDVIRAAIKAVMAGKSVYAKQRRTIEAMLEYDEFQRGGIILDEDSSAADWENFGDLINDPDAVTIAETVDHYFDPESGEVSLTLEELDSYFEESNVPEARQEEGSAGNQNADRQDGPSEEETAEDVSGQSDVEEASESTEDDAAEVAPGKLSVFLNKTVPAGISKITDLAKQGLRLAAYYTQSEGGKSKGTRRPLVAVKDLISVLPTNMSMIYDFLAQDPKDVSGDQKKALLSFFKRAKEWNQLIPGLLYDPGYEKESNREYSFRKPLSDFIIKNEDGSLDMEENVKTAVSFAVFSAALELSSRGEKMTDEQINRALGRPEYAEVTQDEHDLIQRLGSRAGPMRHTMGLRVMEALNIRAKSNTPRDDEARMVAAFGSLALAVARQTGLFVTEIVGNTEIVEAADVKEELSQSTEEARNQAKKKEKDSHKLHEFVRAPRESDGEAFNKLQALLNLNKGSKGIVDQFIGAEVRQTAPTFEKPSFRQKLTKLGMGIPEEQRKALEIANSRKWYLNKEAWYSMVQMDRDAVIQMAGGVRFDSSKHHIDNKKSMEAKYEALGREWDMIQEFVTTHLAGVDEDLNAPFYLPHEVWSQQRVGINSTLFNPQMSKLARFLSYQEGWTSEVDMGEVQSFTPFKLRVLEGLGVNTGKEANLISLQRMKGLFNREEDLSILEESERSKIQLINDAVDALVESKTRELTPSDYEDILQGVKAGGEKMHSFNAIQALAAMRLAQLSGESKFSATVLGEIDGVSNGPVLAHAFFGAANSSEELAEFLKRGGFYTEEDAVAGYNLWRSKAGSLDIYEKMTDSAELNLRLMMEKDPSNPDFQAVMDLIGELKKNGSVTKAGRDLAKDPVRPLVFGSSLHRAIESMGEAFIDSIRKEMEKMPEGDTKAEQAARDKKIQAVNTLLKDAPKLRTGMSKAQILGTSLSPEQILAIKKAFKATFGNAFKDAVETELSVFLSTREKIIQASNLITHVFSAAYASVREQYVAELIKNNVLEVGSTGKPIRDLSRDEEAVLEARIKKLIPTMHTAFSVQEGKKGLSKGLPIMYREAKYADGDLRYTAETPLNGLKDGEGKRSQGKQWKYTSPGVRMTSMPIHSSDAAMSFRGNKGYVGLNNHDAVTMGLPVFNEVGKGLNKATWDTLMGYSPLDEMADTLERTVQGLRSLMNQKDVPANLKKNIAQALVDFSLEAKSEEDFIQPDQALKTVVLDMRITARRARIHLMEVLTQTVLVDQYSSEGAGFEITPEMRKEAQTKLDELRNQSTLISPETEQAIETVTVRTKDFIDQPLREGLLKRATKEAYKRMSRLEKPEAMHVIRALALSNPAQKETLKKLWDAYRKVNHLAQAISVLGLDNAEADSLVRGLATKAGEIRSMDKYAEGKKWWANSRHSSAPNKNDPTLVKEMKAKGGEMSGKEVIDLILSELDKKGQNTFTRLLAQRLATLVKPDLKILMVNNYTDPSLMMDAREFTQVKGLYQSNKEGRQEIYILGDNFKNSQVDNEVLLHEILHSVLFNLLETSTEPNVLEAKAELEVLLDLARKHVNSMGRDADSSFKEATKDLHEFIAYGMTNRAFQDQVLRVIKPSMTKRVADGFKGFVRSLARMLFPKATKSSEVLENGLGQLLVHVSSLLELSEQHAEMVDGSAAAAIMNEYSTQDILQALPGDPHNPGFKDHLMNVLDSIVEKLHGPAGSIKYDALQNAPQDALDAWTQAQIGGQAQFASQMTQSGLRFTEQERFVAEQVEATVRATLDDSASTTSLAVKELNGVYEEARKNLKVEDFHSGDWASATVQEKDQAQRLYDFLFKLEADSSGKTDHLSRFAALGLSHPKINQLLQFKTKDREKLSANASLAQRLRAAFDTLLDFVTNTVNHTRSGQRADEKLKKLVERLVQIEMKRKRKLAAQARQKDVGGAIDRFAQKGMDVVRDKVVQAAQSNFVQTKTTGLGKLAAEVVTVVAKNKTIPVMNQIMKMRDQYLTGRQSLVSGILKEIKHPSVLVQKLFRLTKKMEQDRQRLISNTRRLVLDSFANKGQDLTDAQKEAVSYVFMRTGMHVLLEDNSFSLKDIQGLLENPKALDEAIKSLEDELVATGRFGVAYINHSMDLGYFLATGISRLEVLSRNAGNIARMAGTSFAGQVSQADAAAAEPIIDKLTTLYAVKYNNSARVAQAAQLLAQENARTDGNGIEVVLRLHGQLNQESKKTLFAGQEALMHKGHLAEIVNPYNDVRSVPEDEVQEMFEQGWEVEANLWKDFTDPDPTRKVLMVLRDGGLSRFQSGVMSLTGTNTKGTTLHNGFFNTMTKDGADNIKEQRRQNALRVPRMDRIMQRRPGYDPSKVKQRYMLPVFNADRVVRNYAYVMSEDIRDNLLERDNRFEEILGAFAGSVFDKQQTPEINRNALLALKDMYAGRLAGNKKGLVNVGPNAINKEMRELYSMLPESTRRDVKAIWGKDGVWIEPEMLELVFGSRKLTAASIWDKDSLGYHEKLFKLAVENALYVVARHYLKMSKQEAQKYTKRAAVMVRRGERAWAEMVQRAKTNIVVRTVVVLVDNVISNTLYLKARGMSLPDILYHTNIGMKAAREYHELSKELYALELKLEMGYQITDRAAIERRIMTLKNDLARNPAKPLIDQGAMPTIAEDVADTEDIYSYKTWLSKKTEKYTNKVHPKIRAAANLVTFGEDTAPYKFLRDMTQMSDFVARYALYHHLTTRKVKQLSGDEAFQNVMESFVQYDMPLHPKLQYLDDHGLIMFTKYFLRMQKVLVDLVRDKPLNTLTMILLGNWVADLPIVTDTAMITRIGNNPLEGGALEYPSSVLQIAPIDLGLSLLK